MCLGPADGGLVSYPSTAGVYSVLIRVTLTKDSGHDHRNNHVQVCHTIAVATMCVRPEERRFYQTQQESNLHQHPQAGLEFEIGLHPGRKKPPRNQTWAGRDHAGFE